MMTRRFFLKLTGSALLAVGSGLSLADRAVSHVTARPNVQSPGSQRHWNDPYTRREVSYMKLGANWCERRGNSLIASSL